MLNSFEDAIVSVLLETDYFEFIGDKNTITSESCRKKIEKYSCPCCFPILWTDDKTMRQLLKNTELPSDLVSAACRFAWSQLNWDAIAESVREQA